MCGLLVVYSKENHSTKVFKAHEKLSHRGPDDAQIVHYDEKCFLSFNRLAIMDTSHKGHQPFFDENNEYVILCNGEIYNYQDFFESFKDVYQFESESDCEVLIPLYKELGIEGMSKVLDAEFALVVYDKKKQKIFVSRDPLGVRPLFYGYLKNQKEEISFASEAKALIDICDEVYPFPPGHYYNGDGEFISYEDLTDVKNVHHESRQEVTRKIKTLLTNAVVKRLVSDVPVGFLLSGGLDSALVCSLANQNVKTPIWTFAVGINERPIDVKYAQIVADYLKSNHHTVLFTAEDMFKELSKIIYHLETWDITTIRAGIGMYFVCQYIKQKTPIKVVLTGEVSDEIFGYKYTDFAPSPADFQQEAVKRVKELYMYDVLRADRMISAHSLEARIPFSDKDLIKYVMSLDPAIKMNTTGVGKALLREAFDNGEYLPHEILYREKAAFSDAVGHSMVDHLKKRADEMYSDEEFNEKVKKYEYARPFTKESLMYREIFEDHFPNQASLIKDFWMPNKNWLNCAVNDPSARVLPNYGKSGE